MANNHVNQTGKQDSTSLVTCTRLQNKGTEALALSRI